MTLSEERTMARKNMSEEERLEVSNRMKKYWAKRREENGKPATKPKRRPKKDTLAEELASIKKQTLQAARFIQTCGSTAKAKEIFGMVVTIAEKMS